MSNHKKDKKKRRDRQIVTEVNIIKESDSSAKWLMLAVVAIFLVAALAWGTNRFGFAGLGLDGRVYKKELDNGDQ